MHLHLVLARRSLPQRGHPQAYVYPPEMRATRDLLRRRLHFTRIRRLLAHIENTNSQYNLPVLQKKLTYPSNRDEASGRFSDLAVQQNIDVDLGLIAYYDQTPRELEYFILRTASAPYPESARSSRL